MNESNVDYGVNCYCGDFGNLSDACMVACATLTSGMNFATCSTDAWTFLYNSNGWLLHHFLYVYSTFIYTQSVYGTLLWVFLYKFFEFLIFKAAGYDLLVIQSNPYVDSCTVNTTGFFVANFTKSDTYGKYGGMWSGNMEDERFMTDTFEHTQTDHWWQWSGSGVITVEDLFIKQPLLAIMGIALAYVHVYLLVWMTHYYHKNWIWFDSDKDKVDATVKKSIRGKLSTLINDGGEDDREKHVEIFKVIDFFPKYFEYDQVVGRYYPIRKWSVISRDVCGWGRDRESGNGYRKDTHLSDYVEKLESVPYVIKKGLWPPSAICGATVTNKYGGSKFWHFRKAYWCRLIQLLLLGTPAAALLGLTAPSSVGVIAGIMLYTFYVCVALLIFFGWNKYLFGGYDKNSNKDLMNINLLYIFWIITILVSAIIYAIPWSYRFVRVSLAFIILFTISIIYLIVVTTKIKR